MSEECRKHRIQVPIVAPSTCASCALEKVRGERYEFAVENESLRAELATLKAGQGEAVAHRLLNAAGEVISDWYDGPAPSRITDICGREPDGVRVEFAFAAPPATADDVSMPRELARRLTSSDNHVRQTARRELRVLIYSQEVKS